MSDENIMNPEEIATTRRDFVIDLRKTLLLNTAERELSKREMGINDEQLDEVVKRFAGIADYIESLPPFAA